MSVVSVTVARVKNVVPILLLVFCGANAPPKKEVIQPTYECELKVVYRGGAVRYKEHNGTTKPKYKSYDYSLVKLLTIFRKSDGSLDRVEINTTNGSWYEDDEICYKYLGEEAAPTDNRSRKQYDSMNRLFKFGVETFKPEIYGTPYINKLVADFINNHRIRMSDDDIKYFDVYKLIKQDYSNTEYHHPMIEIEKTEKGYRTKRRNCWYDTIDFQY